MGKIGIVCDNYKVNRFKKVLAEEKFRRVLYKPYSKTETSIIVKTLSKVEPGKGVAITIQRICAEVEEYFKQRKLPDNVRMKLKLATSGYRINNMFDLDLWLYETHIKGVFVTNYDVTNEANPDLSVTNEWNIMSMKPLAKNRFFTVKVSTLYIINQEFDSWDGIIQGIKIKHNEYKG